MTQKVSLKSAQVESFKEYVMSQSPVVDADDYNKFVQNTSNTEIAEYLIRLKDFPKSDLLLIASSFSNPSCRVLALQAITIFESLHSKTAAVKTEAVDEEEEASEEEEAEVEEGEGEDDGGPKLPGFLMKVRSMSDLDVILEKAREIRYIGTFFRVSDHIETIRTLFGKFVRAVLAIILFVTGATILDKLADYIQENHAEKKAVIWISRAIDIIYRLAVLIFAIFMFIIRPDKALKKMLPEEAQEYLPTGD